MTPVIPPHVIRRITIGIIHVAVIVEVFDVTELVHGITVGRTKEQHEHATQQGDTGAIDNTYRRVRAFGHSIEHKDV